MVPLGYTNVDGFDGNAGMLEKAKALGLYKTLHQELLLPETPIKCIPENTYDALISSGAFYPHHLMGCYLP